MSIWDLLPHNLEFLSTLLPMLFRGLKWTVIISVIGISLALVIGSVTGYVLQSRFRTAKKIAEVYLWVIRGTPIMVQALYVYYVIPKMIGIDFSSNQAGVIVVALNSGAFVAEIVRGALMEVDCGQCEAGLSLGLTEWQTLFHCIVPLAFRAALPALFNQFIIAVKDTALLSVIVVQEVTKEAQNYAALSFKTIGTYTTLALFYLAVLSALMLLGKLIERRVRR